MPANKPLFPLAKLTAYGGASVEFHADHYPLLLEIVREKKRELGWRGGEQRDMLNEIEYRLERSHWMIRDDKAARKCPTS